MINWFTPLYLLALVGFFVFFFGRPKEYPDGTTWGPLETVPVTLYIFFIGQILGGFMAIFIPLGLGFSFDKSATWLSDDPVGQFITIFFIEVITLWLITRFLKRRGRKLRDLGFARRPKWLDAGFAILGFFAYIAIFILVISVAKHYIPSINLDQEQDIGFKDVVVWQLPLVFISLVILPPIVEEITVRGLLYSGLKNKLPYLYAVFVTSALFGLAHLQAGNGKPLLWAAGIDTFVLSLILIKLKDKTGALWSSILVHAMKNTVAFVSLFILHVK